MPSILSDDQPEYVAMNDRDCESFTTATEAVAFAMTLPTARDDPARVWYPRRPDLDFERLIWASGQFNVESTEQERGGAPIGIFLGKQN